MSPSVQGVLRTAPLAALAVLGACLGGGPQQASPADVPQLEARLQREPNNTALRARYAAALFAANRCEQATTEAQRVRQQRPADAAATLIVGECAEKAGRYDEALGTYRTFLTANPNAGGTAAVRAREQMALRAYASQQARAALQNEAQLSQQPGDPNTVAVLPLAISSSDSSYQPLSRGLAQMLTADLALIQRFRLVERLQLTALLDELKLGQTGRVEAATAARVGHLIRAGRMVQGAAAIPPKGSVRLEASVVQPTGEVSAPQAATGPLRDLLKLEKGVVVGLSAQLGYQLSEAERRRILENGTQNLAAFLAYSQGLVAEDAGDFQRAAAYYGDAVRADPNFSAAKEAYQSASVANDVQSAPPTQAAATAPPPPGNQPVGAQLGTGATELTPQVTDKNSTGTTTQQSVSTPSASPPATATGLGTPTNVTATIRIFFRLP